MIISEGFEGRTSASWLPDGWTQQSKAGAANNWKADNLENHMIYLQNGKYGICCPMNSKAVDQWLELPEVSLGDDMEIRFNAYLDPFFSFVMGEVNADYTYKEYVKTATLKVMASDDDGATWSELLDLADQYVGVPRTDLAKLADGELKPYAISLAGYAGKNLRLAFRYVGTDGGTVGIDDVEVGPAPLAGVSYLNPMSMAYFGISKNMMALSYTAGIVPVFEPVTFMNYSDDYEAEYSWIIPEDSGTKVVDMDEWALTLEYATDNTSADTRRNNFKTPPALMGQTASSAASKYVSCDYIQAGGSGYFLTYGASAPENLGNVVVTPDMCQAFVARISGFHGAASYFSPYMTVNGRADGMAMSWIEKEFFIEGKTRTSITPVAYCFEDERRAGFAIMLDAYFPYLQVPEDAVNIASNQTEDLAIETFWPAEAHMFSNVPEGLQVSLAGQYNEARLHITYTGSEPLDDEFNVSCPGYTRVVKVKAEAAGIGSIVDDATDAPVRYFTTDGRELPSAPSAPGIYITRQGSKAAKVFID